MGTRAHSASRLASPAAHEVLPAICLVTADHNFLEEFLPELLPWFRVLVRDSYADLARWARQTQAVALLIDIDSDGPEPHAGGGYPE